MEKKRDRDKDIYNSNNQDLPIALAMIGRPLLYHLH